MSPVPSAGRLAGRLALITGASRGIGAATALAFAREGAQLILVARTVGGLEAVDDAIRAGGGGSATLVPMDLAEPGRIEQLGGAILDRFGRLDVLVANAAMLGQLSPLAHTDPKLWARVFEVNVHANQRLIRSLDPLLRAGPAGRVIFLTTGAAHHPMAYWGAYAASKAAAEHMMRIYAAETVKTSLRVNLFGPPVSRTALRALAFPGEDPATLPPPEFAAEALVPLASTACQHHGQLFTADLPQIPEGAARH